jgi:hypothetical protein
MFFGSKTKKANSDLQKMLFGKKEVERKEGNRMETFLEFSTNPILLEAQIVHTTVITPETKSCKIHRNFHAEYRSSLAGKIYIFNRPNLKICRYYSCNLSNGMALIEDIEERAKALLRSISENKDTDNQRIEQKTRKIRPFEVFGVTDIPETVRAMCPINANERKIKDWIKHCIVFCTYGGPSELRQRFKMWKEAATKYNFWEENPP